MEIDGLFTPTATSFEATLFMGAAISITAFPMLARIIYERALSTSPLGTLSLSAGAIDDAGPGSFSRSSSRVLEMAPALQSSQLGEASHFPSCCSLDPPPGITGRRAEREGGVSQALLAISLACSWSRRWRWTQWVHAVFGGFVLGCAMPRGKTCGGLAREAGTADSGPPPSHVLHLLWPQN